MDKEVIKFKEEKNKRILAKNTRNFKLQPTTPGLSTWNIYEGMIFETTRKHSSYHSNYKPDWTLNRRRIARRIRESKEIKGSHTTPNYKLC
jgi:hypothetical protein